MRDPRNWNPRLDALDVFEYFAAQKSSDVARGHRVETGSWLIDCKGLLIWRPSIFDDLSQSFERGVVCLSNYIKNIEVNAKNILK